MNPLSNRAGQWYAARSPQERRLLAVAALVIGAALLFLLAEWTWQEQRRLARQLPDARQQLARMQEEAGEIQRLKRLPANEAVPLATLAQSVQAAARSRGLTISIEPTLETLEVSGSGAFPTVIDWLASLQVEQGLRATRAVLDEASGMTRFTLTLAPATR